MQLLPIPTYAPWWNPVEKLWHWLRQEVLRQHRFGDEVRDLRGADGLYGSVFSQEVLLG